MTQLDKLKQAAEKSWEEQHNSLIRLQREGINPYAFTMGYRIGATSEAAREYWSSDAIEFVKWLIADETQLAANPELNEQLYQEFLKQKEK